MAYALKNARADYAAQFSFTGTVGRLTKTTGTITYYRVTGPGGTPAPATNDNTYTYDTVTFQAAWIVLIDANQQAQFVTDELGNRYLKVMVTETTV